MLDWSIMQRAIQGKKTYERLSYYVEIGNQLGLVPVFFHPLHVNVRANKVKGYFWNGDKLRPKMVSIPRVIHNRVLTGDGKSRSVIRHLSRTCQVFNGLVVRDKGKVHQMLWKNNSVRYYLPKTVRYTRENLLSFLQRYRIVYVKPAVGSVGIGVARIEREDGQYWFTSSTHHMVLSQQELLAEVARWVKNRRYLLQQGIPLVQYEGKTFDIRVSVQKNAVRKWTVSGMVAKVANQRNKLSNLARGGRAVRLLDALAPLFPEEEQVRVLDKIRHAAVEIAKQYERFFPSLADLGMDMGVDMEGNPYLIEVNVRDQRYSFFKAGELAMFKQTYRQPMEYAKSLLTNKIT
jgi:glutathione synthase/RimK-type ligase-like ATP-grasp enzyme